MKLLSWLNVTVYSTAHVQVYKQTYVTHRASRNFEDNLLVGSRATRGIHCSQAIIDGLKILVSNSCHAVLYS